MAKRKPKSKLRFPEPPCTPKPPAVPPPPRPTQPECNTGVDQLKRIIKKLGT